MMNSCSHSKTTFHWPHTTDQGFSTQRDFVAPQLNTLFDQPPAALHRRNSGMPQHFFAFFIMQRSSPAQSMVDWVFRG